MRITQGMLNNNMMHNLNNSMGSIDKYIEMLSTGKRVTKPSDDPISAVRAMMHRTGLTEIEQYKRNTNEAMNWMELTDDTLDGVGTVIHRARELVVRGANDTNSVQSREAIASELRELRDQIGVLANTTMGGRFIFAGTDTLNPPFDKETGEFTNENMYQVEVEMGKGIYLPMNINGASIFRDADDPDDDRESIFKVLDDAIAALEDPEATGHDIEVFLGKIDKNVDMITATRASLGAKINRIELVDARLADSEYSTTKLLSDAEDADIPKVIVNLKNQENVHQAALAAGSRIIQRSLVDFLR